MMGTITGLTWIDWAVLAIVLISLAMGVVRGVVKEIFSLIGWIVAFWLAKTFSLTGAHWLVPIISSETVRLMAAFVMLFLAGLFITALVGYVFNTVVTSAGLGVLNRVLGGLFGFLRGGLFVMILVLLAGMTPLPAQHEWKSSIFVDWGGERGASLLIPYLPASIVQRIHF
ncbi:MAG: CvpA family protein [Betaproteobacteria bacterium]|nr:CvpA family protein [Betaproteobacteria bacterium]